MTFFILKKIRPLVLLSASLLSIAAQAGIVMGGTRVVFQEGKKKPR